jgi:hypothetical protein
MDERQLGYDLPSEDPDVPSQVQGLVFRAIKYCRQTYISFPDVVSLHLPQVNKAKWFSRRHLDRVKGWTLPNMKATFPIRIDHVQVKDAKATVHYRDITYFHPLLMLPDGEAMGFLREVFHVLPHVPVHVKAMVGAFHNLLLWIHDPQLLLQGEGQFGTELESLTDPSFGCPIKLKSPQDRLDFLFQKGRNSIRRGLAYSDKPGAHGKRSARMGSYDHWVVWHCSTTELPFLGYQLNKTQQCEYIAKRWLHWRRPSSLKNHLIADTYYRLPARLPLLGKQKTVTDLIAEAEDMFGPAFTVT